MSAHQHNSKRCLPGDCIDKPVIVSKSVSGNLSPFDSIDEAMWTWITKAVKAGIAVLYSPMITRQAAIDAKKAPTVSLTCPISGKLMKLPVKGPQCEHLECFGLEALLDLVKDASRKCPICDAVIDRKGKLIIDGYLVRAVTAAKQAGRGHVQLMRNGSFRLVQKPKKCAGLPKPPDVSTAPADEKNHTTPGTKTKRSYCTSSPAIEAIPKDVSANV